MAHRVGQRLMSWADEDAQWVGRRGVRRRCKRWEQRQWKKEKW